MGRSSIAWVALLRRGSIWPPGLRNAGWARNRTVSRPLGLSDPPQIREGLGLQDPPFLGCTYDVVMTDPFAIAGAALSVPVALDVYKRLLGPGLDLMGEGIKEGLLNRRSSIHKVAERADAKTNAQRPGSIPPRVAADVFDKAQWADDEFVAEYLSGVLASSRSTDGRDDRGIVWTSLVGRLSSDSLRLHYAIFSALRTKLRGKDVDYMGQWTQKHLVLNYYDLLPGLEFEVNQVGIRRLLDAAYVLEREGLISGMTHGSANHFTGLPYRNYVLPDIGDIFMTATTIEGCHLFLYGHGYGATWASAIADDDRDFPNWPDIAPSLSSIPAVWLDDLPLKSN